jgi:DNA polymerase-3 subunit alpha/error-prone DNA polymerase
LLVIALDTGELQTRDRNLMLLQEPVKEYKLPLETFSLRDAFDEIELLSFPVSCTPFDLLQTKYRGTVLAKDLLHHHKDCKMLAYLISRTTY